MTIRTSHPGVYVTEIPSGVRAITGVATSITAIVGPTRWGPEDEPKVVNGSTEFERLFGGLWPRSPLSFAVRSFFLGGDHRPADEQRREIDSGPRESAAGCEASCGGYEQRPQSGHGEQPAEPPQQGYEGKQYGGPGEDPEQRALG
jgi:hypothetical protein